MRVTIVSLIESQRLFKLNPDTKARVISVRKRMGLEFSSADFEMCAYVRKSHFFVVFEVLDLQATVKTLYFNGSIPYNISAARAKRGQAVQQNSSGQH